jgi:hypothetical protein
MKKTLVVLFSLSALVLGIAVAASAQPPNAVWVKIPFAFHAGDQLMPAGEYLVEMPKMGGFAAGTMLRVISQDGANCQTMLSQRIFGITTDTDFHITFTKYGDAYFLSKVRNSDLGAELARSRTEKKVAGEYTKAAGSAATLDLVVDFSRAK